MSDRSEVRTTEQSTSTRCSAMPVLEGQVETQMRRMLKEAADAEDGGLLSELHAFPGSGVGSSALISGRTVPVWIAVTCGITFLETFRRSALTQSARHDWDTSSGLSASTSG